MTQISFNDVITSIKDVQHIFTSKNIISREFTFTSFSCFSLASLFRISIAGNFNIDCIKVTNLEFIEALICFINTKSERVNETEKSYF